MKAKGILLCLFMLVGAGVFAQGAGASQIRELRDEITRLEQARDDLYQKMQDATVRNVLVQKQLRRKVDSLRAQNEIIRRQMIAYRDAAGVVIPMPGGGIGTAGGGDGGNAAADFSELRRRYEELEANYNNLSERFNSLGSDLRSARIKIDNLEEENGRLTESERAAREDLAAVRADLEAANASLAAANADLEQQRKVINCVDGFLEEVELLSTTAEDFLLEARDHWATVTTLKVLQRPSAQQTALKDSLLFSIWSTYQEYSGDTISENCGGMPLSTPLDFMKAEDHLIMSYILAYDLNTIVNQYGNFTDFRIIQVNADLLHNVSQIFKKAEAEGNYNLKQEAQLFINRLPSLIIPAVGQEGNSRVMSELREIPVAYRKKDYAKVLGLYNRYERVLFDETIQADKELLADVKSCVGVVLLFNLGDAEELQGLSYESSWLDRAIPNRVSYGEALLREVLDLRKMISKPVFERAAFAMAQRF